MHLPPGGRCWGWGRLRCAGCVAMDSPAGARALWECEWVPGCLPALVKARANGSSPSRPAWSRAMISWPLHTTQSASARKTQPPQLARSPHPPTQLPRSSSPPLHFFFVLPLLRVWFSLSFGVAALLLLFLSVVPYVPSSTILAPGFFVLCFSTIIIVSCSHMI
ncbi:hypothetical protein EDC01DRAFT_656305 [Geopyxis carbonaria]|nr:hypothetical protein EDC01DRAFT_656305 [Geopyxis carbonaria]